MNWLRNRIIILLVLSIVSVVGFATFAAIKALEHPFPAAVFGPIANQIHIDATLAMSQPELAAALGIKLQGEPPDGARDEHYSAMLAKAMRHKGLSNEVAISENRNNASLEAAVRLGENQWLVLPIPDTRPPRDALIVLAIWVALIVMGSAAISVFAASMILRPLRLIQAAIERIGPEGVLPHVPEIGPTETRMTAKALNRLSAHLKAATESRMRVVAAAGHDLRTPMTRMRLRAEFIEDDEERAKWLSDLEELDSIADSAIRLVREEVSNDTMTEIDIGRLIDEVVDGLKPLGMEVSARTLKSLLISGAPLAIKRALSNLIVNAATHGGGATITLERQHATVRLVIDDNGPGIPDELLAHVFEPFFRVDMARRKTLPGAGLGLAIAKEIIERFGGTITIENRLSGGLRQTVSFPLSVQKD
ncbi:HAMP domain-containing protein [Martelella alba]|uniref:histidine kinase n=1 Tax=Martelella alba TaxID=2590451 RepID=A0A506UAR4_9HYPH|nr:ATP-binding protein [Martelella alba]TPW28897.1 HAMP domain-containing protein [Martelella alba]